MSLKGRIEKLEQEAGTIEQGNKVELVIPWPDGEPIRLLVTPRQHESIMRDLDRAYGSTPLPQQ